MKARLVAEHLCWCGRFAGKLVVWPQSARRRSERRCIEHARKARDADPHVRIFNVREGKGA